MTTFDTPTQVLPSVSDRSRLESVDIVRGVIMILMALDHTRDFFGSAANPTNLAATTVALFFTRWVTNFCAPGFFMLTGVGAYLSLRKKIEARIVEILIYARPVADLSGTGGDSRFRLAIQL